MRDLARRLAQVHVAGQDQVGVVRPIEPVEEILDVPDGPGAEEIPGESQALVGLALEEEAVELALGRELRSQLLVLQIVADHAPQVGDVPVEELRLEEDLAEEFIQTLLPQLAVPTETARAVVVTRTKGSPGQTS